MLASPSPSAADAAAQLLDVDRLGEGRADHLAADEIDAEVQAAHADQHQAGDGGDDRQDQRDVAPAHEVDVGVVGNEFQQEHGRRLKYCSTRGRLRLTHSATSIRVKLTAVNTEVTMPIISTTAKPRIGPEPK